MEKRPPFAMISARFFTDRGNLHAGFRGRMVNLWVRLLVSNARLAGADGAEDGELRGMAARPMAIARAVGAVEEYGREGGERFVRDGLQECVDAGLLTWDESGDAVGICDWDIWSTNPIAERRLRDRERKRAARARVSADTSADTASATPPRTIGSAEVSADKPDTAAVSADNGDLSADTDLQNQDPVDPIDRDPGPPESPPRRGALSSADKAAIAALVDPPDDPVRLDMADKWWRELKNLACLPHFGDMVGFIRWYGHRLREERLVPKAETFQRITTSRGVRVLRKLRERLDDDYAGDWAAFRPALYAASKALLSNPFNRGESEKGGPWIELDKHLLKDADQFNRHRVAGERPRPLATTVRPHSSGDIAGAWGQQRQTPRWAGPGDRGAAGAGGDE